MSKFYDNMRIVFQKNVPNDQKKKKSVGFLGQRLRERERERERECEPSRWHATPHLRRPAVHARLAGKHASISNATGARSRLNFHRGSPLRERRLRMDGPHGPPDPTQSQILTTSSSPTSRLVSPPAPRQLRTCPMLLCPMLRALAGLKTPSVWRFFCRKFVPKCFGKFVIIQGLAFDYIWSLDLRVPKRTMNLKGCSNISGTAHSANAVLGPPSGLPPARLFHATIDRFLSCPWAPPLEPGRGAGEVTGGRLADLHSALQGSSGRSC